MELDHIKNGLYILNITLCLGLYKRYTFFKYQNISVKIEKKIHKTRSINNNITIQCGLL